MGVQLEESIYIGVINYGKGAKGPFPLSLKSFYSSFGLFFPSFGVFLFYIDIS